MISARTLRVLRIVGVVYMLLAIAYLVMPLDLDRVGWMGYIDDFFLFMSAFTFMNGGTRVHSSSTFPTLGGVFCALPHLDSYPHLH